MQRQPCILALDQGTTSSRAILFDPAGKPVAVGRRPLRQSYPHPGWVEQDAEEIFSSQLGAALEACEQAGVTRGDVLCIGVTNQRETAVLWERATGKPVCPAIGWQCRRTADICARLEAEGCGELIRARTGLVIDPYFSGTKLQWLLDRDETLRRRAENGELLFGTVESWLIWRLTGGASHVTDVSNASRTMMFHTGKLAWDEDILRLLRIPAGLLPRPVPSAGDFGAVADDTAFGALAGVPIRAASGDQQAALFGQGCFRAGMAKNTYGTGCFTLMNLGSRRVEPENGLVTTVGWQLGGETTYVLEGSVFHAGSAIQWLRDELGLVAEAHETDLLAERARADSGAVFVPAFTGLGAPYWAPDARGSFFGLTRDSGRAELCRAVLQAIACEVCDLVRTMDGITGTPVSVLRADGGASVSNFLMQLQADLLGVPVDRPAMVETTAWGAACLAGLAAGVWPGTEALEKLRQSERIFAPAMETSAREGVLARWRRAVEMTVAFGK